jgi:ferredoxin-nitrite reductase
MVHPDYQYDPKIVPQLIEPIAAGRADAGQLRELSRLAEVYGSGEVRFTPRQNALLVGVPPSKLKALLKEPLLERFHPRPMNRVFMVPASEKSRD